MGYNKEDYARIKAEFSQKYILARQEAEMRSFELRSRFPRIREIDSLLARTGMDIMGVIASGKNTDEQIARIRERNEKLIEERRNILRNEGYPENYSDVKYECEICGDTGFVGTKMCTCMKKALALAGYESAGIGKLMGTQSFENFSLDYYKKENANEMTQSVARVRDFAENFDGRIYKNFLFLGGTGLGKTHLSTAVAKTVIDGGHSVTYVTAVGMIGDFEKKRFGNGVGAANNDIERYSDCDLLIIDDFGTEVVNQFTVSCIYDVINERMNSRKCTIISTNLMPKEIDAKYGERIYSRIMGEYNPIIFIGRDIRQQRIIKNK